MYAEDRVIDTLFTAQNFDKRYPYILSEKYFGLLNYMYYFTLNIKLAIQLHKQQLLPFAQDCILPLNFCVQVLCKYDNIDTSQLRVLITLNYATSTSAFVNIGYSSIKLLVQLNQSQYIPYNTKINTSTN